METTHTLLIHGEVPEHFWGDAILTTCYLINRMPSSVLKNNIPLIGLEWFIKGRKRGITDYDSYNLCRVILFSFFKTVI